MTSIDEILQESVEESVKHQYVGHGDVVIITAGVPVGEAGTTNLMKIHVIGDLACTRTRNWQRQLHLVVLLLRIMQQKHWHMIQKELFLSQMASDRDMMPAIEKCAGLITEEGGLTSHGAIVGLSLGIPVIVGVENATKLIKHGNEITMDAESGVIYNGHASVLIKNIRLLPKCSVSSLFRR